MKTFRNFIKFPYWLLRHLLAELKAWRDDQKIQWIFLKIPLEKCHWICGKSISRVGINKWKESANLSKLLLPIEQNSISSFYVKRRLHWKCWRPKNGVSPGKLRFTVLHRTAQSRENPGAFLKSSKNHRAMPVFKSVNRNFPGERPYYGDVRIYSGSIFLLSKFMTRNYPESLGYTRFGVYRKRVWVAFLICIEKHIFQESKDLV